MRPCEHVKPARQGRIELQADVTASAAQSIGDNAGEYLTGPAAGVIAVVQPEGRPIQKCNFGGYAWD